MPTAKSDRDDRVRSTRLFHYTACAFKIVNRLELRERFGSRTYEAGNKLLKNGAVALEQVIDDDLRIYKVRDNLQRHVVVWDRKGDITVECGCTPKAMGCRHCACVYMYLLGEDKDSGSDTDDIRRSIDSLAGISFDPSDYEGETTVDVLITRFYDFIQKKIDKRISNLCESIEELSEGDEKEQLYRLLWEATDGFESPHDEWSKDTILANGGMEFDDED